MSVSLVVPEVAARLRCSEDTVKRKLLRTGALRGSLIAGRWVVSERDLDAYVTAQANVAESPAAARRRRRRAP